MSDTNDNKLIWGVVHSGPLTFIGAFCDWPMDSSYSTDKKEAVAAAIKNIERDIANGKVVRLSPVMELTAPWQPVRQQTPTGERVGMSKSALPSPYGFTVGELTLHMFQINAVAFLDEMSDGDRRVYQSYVTTIEKNAQAERAARLGIDLASSGYGGGHA